MFKWTRTPMAGRAKTFQRTAYIGACPPKYMSAHTDSQTILNMLLENGGATVARTSRKPVSFPSGFQVAYKGAEKIIGTITPASISDYMDSHKQAIKEGKFFGFWINDGSLYADISTHIEDQNEAVVMGREHEQIALWNWATFEELKI